MDEKSNRPIGAVPIGAIQLEMNELRESLDEMDAVARGLGDRLMTIMREPQPSEGCKEVDEPRRDSLACRIKEQNRRVYHLTGMLRDYEERLEL